MFDFEKLEVYQKLKRLNIKIIKLLDTNKSIDLYLKDQLKRATLSISLNLSEGAGRVSPADKKRFYVIARSSVYECVAIIDVLKEINSDFKREYNSIYLEYESISKILLALYRSLK